MPVSVVVGGQYGSEGKGKVALELVRRDPSVKIAVRPGGTNSGHTGYTKTGKRIILRQLPAAAIDGGITVVLPAGTYIDVPLLVREMAEISLPPSRLLIDPRAHIISDADRAWERDADLLASIGSTGSGTGAAVMSRLARNSDGLPTARQAADVPELTQFISDTVAACLQILKRGDRVLIEGTQGFGLSPLHGDYWPHVTSRDTTAAAFISEAGLSPLDVDDVTLVFRAFPIRVGGNSGPLPNEITWEHIRYAAGSPIDLTEHTSVTKKVRRVAEFDFQLAKRAVAINQPTRVIMNHLDHVDWACRAAGVTARGWEYIRHVEKGLGRNVDWVGTGESCFAELSPSVALRA